MPSGPFSTPDTLEALERRGDELVAFSECEQQANAYIKREGTQKLVSELREAIEDRRRIRLGTVNTIVLLRHIERLEAELAKEPYRGN